MKLKLEDVVTELLYENIDYIWENYEDKLRKKELKHSVNKSNPEIMAEIMTRFNGEDVYITFRDSVRDSMINPRNTYETPTGVYCYPLGPILKNAITNDWSELSKLDQEEIFSRKYFPYQNQMEFIAIFHVKKNNNILYSSKDESQKIVNYVNSIKNLYPNNETIIKECDNFISNGSFYSNYTSKEMSGVWGFWLFIYHLGGITKEKRLNNYFTSIANKIGLDGVVDDAGLGLIHPNEPIQAAFFKVKTISDFYTVLSKSRGATFQKPRDKPLLPGTLPTKKSMRNVLLDILNKKYPDLSVNFIDDFDYDSILKNRIPFPIDDSYYGLKFFTLNRYNGELTEIPLEQIDISQYSKRVLKKYIKTKAKKHGLKIDSSSITEVNDVYFTLYLNDEQFYPIFIDKNGEKNIGENDIYYMSNVNNYLTAYFNTKFDTLYNNAQKIHDNTYYVLGQTPLIVDQNNKIFSDKDILNDLLKKTNDSLILAGIVNTLTGESYEKLDKSGNYLISDKGVFINSNSLMEITFDAEMIKKIDNTQMLTKIFNYKYNLEYIFKTPFNIFGNALVYDGKKHFLVNEYGQPSVENINSYDELVENLKSNPYVDFYALYELPEILIFFINEKYKKDFIWIDLPRMGVMQAMTNERLTVYINKEGEITPITYEDYVKNHTNENITAYFNSLFNQPKYKDVYSIFTDKLYYAKHINGFYLIIDVNGKETVSDLTFKNAIEFNSTALLLAYLNTKIHDFKYTRLSTIFEQPLGETFYIFETDKDGYVFVNKYGEETIEGVNPDNLKNDFVKKVYELQKKQKENKDKLINEIKRNKQIMGLRK